MLKLNPSKKKKKSLTKNRIPNHIQSESTQVFIAREERWFIVVREIHSPIQRDKPRRMMFRKTDDDLNISCRRVRIHPWIPLLFSRRPSEKNEISSSALSVNHRLPRPLFARLRGYYLRDTPPPNTALWRWIIETFIPPRFAFQGLV